MTTVMSRRKKEMLRKLELKMQKEKLPAIEVVGENVAKPQPKLKASYSSNGKSLIIIRGKKSEKEEKEE